MQRSSLQWLTISLLVLFLLNCGLRAERQGIPSEVEATIASISDDIAAEHYEKLYEEAADLWRQDSTLEQSNSVLMMIRTKLDYEHPSVSSVTPLWKGADWHERETAEMLGIDFPGHPNLVPLLLEEGVDERPLRKSHPLVPIFADRPGVVTRPHDNGA